jgi:hypothetical protein
MAISFPVAASQIRADLSLDAVTISEPQRLNVAEYTSPLCPFSGKSHVSETIAAS